MINSYKFSIIQNVCSINNISNRLYYNRIGTGHLTSVTFLLNSDDQIHKYIFMSHIQFSFKVRYRWPVCLINLSCPYHFPIFLCISVLKLFSFFHFPFFLRSARLMHVCDHYVYYEIDILYGFILFLFRENAKVKFHR